MSPSREASTRVVQPNGVVSVAPSTMPAETSRDGSSAAREAPKRRKPNNHEIYVLPNPIRTFPLPNFYPWNPVSWVYAGAVWLWHSVSLLKEPSGVHVGVWSPGSRSVHVYDEDSMHALWRQGFFGKGHLSRSEPNWHKSQLVKLGLEETHVDELFTVQRREARQQMKWERARAEQEKIKQTLQEEKGGRLRSPAPLRAPVGPLDTLSLQTGVEAAIEASHTKESEIKGWTEPAPPVGPLELLALPNSARKLPNGGYYDEDGASRHLDRPSAEATRTSDKPTLVHMTSKLAEMSNGDSSITDDVLDNGRMPTPIKRRKSVRFSPTVESTTFQLSDPPSAGAALLGGKAAANGHVPERIPGESLAVEEKSILSDSKANTSKDDPKSNGHPQHGIAKADETKLPGEALQTKVVNKEHLQLTREEAFFLSYGLGVLKVIDPGTNLEIPNQDLLRLFRRYSYIPAAPCDGLLLRPDDKFLFNYAAYHHFRTLGWVVRAGLKFACDWMLYLKGPVFDHAEYGVLVFPSYSHQWWKDHPERRGEVQKMTWHAFFALQRGLGQALKTMVLIHVEIPPPHILDDMMRKDDATGQGDIADVLALYKVHDTMVSRVNLNRIGVQEMNQKTSEALGTKAERKAAKAEKDRKRAEKQLRKTECRTKDDASSASSPHSHS